MKAPDKIYIAETPNKLIEIWSDEPIESNPHITEHEYIRKDALLEFMEDVLFEDYPCYEVEKVWNNALEAVIEKLNSM